MKNNLIRLRQIDYLTAFGDISGRMKMTKEEAKRLFNKDLKDGAKGVFFRRRNNKLEICNWMPQKKKSKKVIKRYKLFLTIHKLACQELKSLIHPVWNKLAKEKNWAGFTLFESVNLKRVTIEFKWEDLLITDGKLNPPKIKKASVEKNKIKLIIKPIDKALGIMILNQKMKFTHIKPVIYKQNPVIIKIKSKEPIIYVYLKDGNEYSPSVSIIPKLRLI